MQTSFPPELAALRQWVCWRLEPDPKGRDTKVPYNPKSGNKASSTNPDTWTDLDFAARACELHRYSGLGFMFTREAGIVGVDIDHCIVDGALNETAAAILEKLPPTYIEISPSGTGLHIFLRGVMPAGGSKNSKTGVEMYAHSRYFTMTGKPYGDCPIVVAADDGALAWIHEHYIAPPKKEKKQQAKRKAGQPLTDDEILEKARSAKNGAAFAALWEGRWEGEFASQSEADLALCCKLAFWTGKNRDQISTGDFVWDI